MKINEEHTYARWRFDLTCTDSGDILFPESETTSCYMHQMLNGKPTETLLGLYERAALRKGTHFMHTLLSRDPRVKKMLSDTILSYEHVTVLRDLTGRIKSGRLSWFIYMHHVIPTDLLAPEIISTRLFATLENGLEPSLSWSIGLDIVDCISSRQFRVALIDSSARPVHLHEETANYWALVLVEEHELIPFTWPSDDEDVERAQFFTSHFGHGGDSNSSV